MTDGLNTTREYTFGEFTYRSSDNTLRRNGETLSMTPKALDLLRIFIANPGKLLSKDELMNGLWPDSYVEESNLAVTIRRLRIALGDDAHNPAYVATVARQGYRFVAFVGQEKAPELSRPIGRSERSIRYLIPVAVAAVLLIASISLGSLYLRDSRSQAAPILASPFAAQKFSTSGRVQSAVISPDGEKLVYTVGSRSGEAVWLREIASENNVEIIPASGDDYYNFEFAPDGNTLYFTRGRRTIDDPADIYRISVFGGVPTKIISNTRGWISVSPDGRLLSFVRCALREKEYCSLWTANSEDGKNERMLASRPSPFRIADNEIAPDGKSLIFAVGQSENAGSDFGLSSIDLETGVEREISNARFFDIRSLEILPDKSGVLLTASRGSTRSFQVWKIDTVDGVARPLTKDSASYSSISLDNRGSRLIATQVTNDFQLVRANLSQLARKEILAEPAGAFAFDSNGEIVFQSDSSGDLEIWRMDRDGLTQRQLTHVPGDDIHPIVSRHSRDVFFCSNRSGGMQVWAMKADGSDQHQVTKRYGGPPLFAGEDWVYYQHGIDRTLWRVSLDDGSEELVLNVAPYRGPFVFSPSGAQAAFVKMRAGKPVILIVSIPDGAEQSSFEMANGEGRFELAWLPDESAIAYSLSSLKDETNSLWLQPTTGGPPQPTADIGDDQIIFIRFPFETDAIAFVQGRWRHDVVMLSGFQ